MKKWSIVFLLPLSLWAANSPREFCQERIDLNNLKNLIVKRENLISFTNHGGLVNGRICWWYSRFERIATYLTYYRPD